jgi:hypothetical protein
MIADQVGSQLEEIDYPSSDGQPMAETGIHANAMVLLKQALDESSGDFRSGRQVANAARRN